MDGGPLRTCVACRRRRPQADLIRVARSPDGGLAVDHARTMPGRGAYVCPVRSCVDEASAPGVLGRALRAGGSDPDGVRDELRRVIGG